MINITKGSSNVFEDVGFEPVEAADLKLRTHLMRKLRNFIRDRKWTQTQTADFFGEPKDRIKHLMDIDIEHFTVEQLQNLGAIVDRLPTAQAETISLADNTILEVLRLTSGEQRIEICTVAKALGRHSGYLDSFSASYMSALEDRGFTNERKYVFVPSHNMTYATISVADFIKVAIQGALLGEAQATIILAAFAEIGVESLVANSSS